MEVIGEILKNKYIVIPLLLWFCIQIFKVIYDYITTKVKISAIAKIGVCIPSYFPIRVASPTTTAECELGIPPAPNILLKLNFLVVIKS